MILAIDPGPVESAYVLWDGERIVKHSKADNKPLFIPLKAEYFEAFRARRKFTELRVYGPRWNERTCTPGRRVVLSKGYGKHARLEGHVVSFRSRPVEGLEPAERTAFMACYGSEAGDVAAILIRLEPEEKR